MLAADVGGCRPGRFDAVALLAGELQARRLAGAGVVVLDTRKRQRGD